MLLCAPSLCLHMPTCRHQHTSRQFSQAANMRYAWLCGLHKLVLLAAYQAAPKLLVLQTGTAGDALAKHPVQAAPVCAPRQIMAIVTKKDKQVRHGCLP